MSERSDTHPPPLPAIPSDLTAAAATRPAEALAAPHQGNYLDAMDTIKAEPVHTPRAETGAERHARISWEAEGIAEADAELDAGLYVDVAEVRAWINSLRTDTPLPPPPTRHR